MEYPHWLKTLLWLLLGLLPLIMIMMGVVVLIHISLPEQHHNVTTVLLMFLVGLFIADVILLLAIVYYIFRFRKNFSGY